MANDYRELGIGNVKISVGTVVKYASLLTGIYSECKDEQDFAIATAAGIGYLIGESVKGWGHSDNDHEKYSQLEETLRKG